MAQALRDACFEAARIAANDSSERPTKTAFAIFKETSMKAAVLTQRLQNFKVASMASGAARTPSMRPDTLPSRRVDGVAARHATTHRSPRPWTAIP